MHKSVELTKIGDSVRFNPTAAIIDVETTGLIVDNSIRVTRKNLEEYPWNFPRIVQICWIILDDFGNYKMNSFYVKQKESIPREAICIHGITNDKCNNEGWDLSFVLKILSRDIEKVDSIVGHNINFDYKVLRAEYLKEHIGFPLINKNKIDTMRMVGKILGRPHGFKISLQNAADFLFSDDPKWGKLKHELNFHNAEVDSEITAYIYFALKDLYFQR